MYFFLNRGAPFFQTADFESIFLLQECQDIYNSRVYERFKI